MDNWIESDAVDEYGRFQGCRSWSKVILAGQGILIVIGTPPHHSLGESYRSYIQMCGPKFNIEEKKFYMGKKFDTLEESIKDLEEKWYSILMTGIREIFSYCKNNVPLDNKRA